MFLADAVWIEPMIRFCIASALILVSATSLPAQSDSARHAYPKVTGYASFVHPIISFDDRGSAFNFSGSYTVGFPVGVNILKSDLIGFSCEITPFIRVEDGKDQVSSLMFHPGVMFRLKHGFTINTRLAFETTGRYGATLVFSKVLLKGKDVNYFLATPVGFRTGSGKASTVGIGVQLGVSF